MLALFYKKIHAILSRCTLIFSCCTLITCMLITPLAFAEKAFSEQANVKNFINEVAKKHKFNKAKLIALFNNVKQLPQIMQSLQKPLEVKPWNTYQLLFVSEWRIEHGVKFWKKYEATLKKAEKEFGVPASIIVATIGVETRY